jgi:transposase-like protein
MAHLVSQSQSILTPRPPVLRPLEQAMNEQELQAWLDILPRLHPEQRGQLRRKLQAVDSRDEVHMVLQQRCAAGPICPHCQGTDAVRNGHADGLQRFRCKTCRRSFNALTGTPLARLRQRDNWLSQAQALNAGLSVRKAALSMDVHRTTAFRWRHRFLALLAGQKAQSLQGIAEADETYELHSLKGQRRQLLAAQRAPRRRGGKATKRGLSAEQVPILVLRDRSGATTDFVLKRRDKAAVQELLPQALAKDAVLCSDGSGLLANAAMGLGFEHEGVNLSKGVRIRGAWHIQNVNAYHSRWKQWMGRFKGVATSYLENYLGWFRALDRNAQNGAKPASFLNIAVGAPAVIR